METRLDMLRKSLEHAAMDYAREAMRSQKDPKPATFGDLLDSAVLCYIKNNLAWFTTQELSKQWGDDWNDAPYEHNVGDPYGWTETVSERYKTEDGKTGFRFLPNPEPRYELVSVFFWTDMDTPNEYMGNLSVEQINRGMSAWLSDRWSKNPQKPILAGTSLREFISRIRNGGGKVWVELEALTS